MAGGGEGRGRCPPRSQRCPSQPSLQMHCQGSTQRPFTQPGKVTHWSHRGPCQPGWHLWGVGGGEREPVSCWIHVAQGTCKGPGAGASRATQGRQGEPGRAMWPGPQGAWRLEDLMTTPVPTRQAPRYTVLLVTESLSRKWSPSPFYRPLTRLRVKMSSHSWHPNLSNSNLCM